MRTLRFGLLVLAACLADIAAAQVPGLHEAFGPGKPGAGAVARGTDLIRVEVPTEQYPDALCGDGTPGVYYVRAAQQPAFRDNWVIYLQGGGSCEDGEDCHDRWLGRDGNFGANKLSSHFAPEGGIKGGGIQSPERRNPFAAWNQVFIYYCSSDGWGGQAQGRVTSAVHQGMETTYQVHFLGTRIIDAVIDQLRATQGPLGYVDADGERHRLPDLDRAGTVLFAGSSAGGNGVRTNADRIHEFLRSQREDCQDDGPCGLRFAAVIDASYGLASESLDHSMARICGPDPVTPCSYETVMRWRWYEVTRGFRNAIADQSCVEYHLATDDVWRCADGAHLIEHHLATPFFVRVDLQDSLIMGNTVEAGYLVDGVPLDRALYGYLQEQQLRAVPSIGLRSEELRIPTALEPPGVFGPQCGDHETLRSNAPTFRRSIETPEGQPIKMLEALQHWLDGNPVALVETFDPAGPPAGCGF